jgi:hypothetical protein
VQEVNLTVDALVTRAVLPFWQAVLDCRKKGPDDLVDPHSARADAEGNEADVATWLARRPAWVGHGHAWLGGLAELRDVTYLGLPTSHWPMWSRPQELAAIVGDVARTAAD